MASLSLNKSIDIRESLSGKNIIFRSSTLDLTKPASGDNTNLNLLNHNGDTILHISFRRYSNTITLNTRKAGASSPWDTELSYPNLERAFGPSTSSATVKIKVADDTYQIFINENYLATFSKRYPGDVKMVSYVITIGEGSLLSNPITVEIQA